MNVRKVKEIIKFDVEKSIQNKWFVILNIVAFISIIIATNWSHISKYLDEHNLGIPSEQFKIQVLDNENLVFEDVKEAFKDDKNIEIEKVEKNKYSKKNIPDKDVLLVEVKSDSKNIIKIKSISKEGVDAIILDKLQETLLESRSKIFASKNGITVEELDVLNKNLDLERVMLGVDAENSDTKELIKLIATVIMYMCLLIVLSRIANEIANAKVSKSIEYVLTSVSAKEYLLAKVLSSTITIVIQLIYTIIYYMIGNLISSFFVSASSSTEVSINLMGNIDKNIMNYILAMIGYLIFTVFLTTLIQAALSSKTTNVAEAGNTTILLVMLVIILYMVSNGLINSYTKVTTFMYIISCLPIVSTFFVPSMMIIGQATTAQIIISFIVLIASIPLIFNFCAKVFKNGILDYTSKKKSLFSKNNKKEELTLREKQDIELRKSQAKKFAFVIGMAMILFIVFQTLCAIIFNTTLTTYLSDKLSYSNIILIENSLILIISLGLTCLFIKFYNTDKKILPKQLTGFQKFEIIVIGIAVIVGIQVFVTWLLEKIGINYDVIENVGITSGESFIEKIFFVLAMAGVPAIFEELLFRKWILNSSRKYGNVFAVIFSALLFGLYHMNLGQGIFALLIGILFGIIAIYTCSIKYTVLLHFLNNAYACMVMILGEEAILLKIILNIILAISVVGVILLVKNIPNLRKMKKDDFKINKDCKYLFKNYTFVLSMIMIVVMFLATENILN